MDYKIYGNENWELRPISQVYKRGKVSYSINEWFWSYSKYSSNIWKKICQNMKTRLYDLWLWNLISWMYIHMTKFHIVLVEGLEVMLEIPEMCLKILLKMHVKIL